MTRKKHILIVDDEIVGAMSLANFVQYWGFYDCELAGSVEAALAEVERCRPDLIIMDIKLGENSRGGINAAKTILEKYKVPIIFISGYDIEEIRAEGPNGTTAFLSKPLDLDLLKSTVESLLKKTEQSNLA